MQTSRRTAATFAFWWFLWTLISPASTLPKIYVDPKRGGHFVDDLGRVRIFRGLNSVYKVGTNSYKQINIMLWLCVVTFYKNLQPWTEIPVVWWTDAGRFKDCHDCPGWVQRCPSGCHVDWGWAREGSDQPDLCGHIKGGLYLLVNTPISWTVSFCYH